MSILRTCSCAAIACLAIVMAVAGEPDAPPSEKNAHHIALAMHDGEAVIELRDVDAANLAELKAWPADDPRWRALFAVRVAAEKSQPEPPVLWGRYSTVEGQIRFEPRFPLQAGLAYQVAFHPDKLPVAAKTAKKLAAMTTTVSIPRLARGAETQVTAVYPTSSVLPENLLRFYLHFSAPMSLGEAYDHVKLIDSNGKALEMPFLELAEELWDPEHQRFTLLIHPGHIKRGLRSREEAGTALVEGREYTLVIAKAWADAKGEPLAKDFRKTFKVGPEEKRALEFDSWKVAAPAVGTREPLELRFPKPLDQALLERMIRVSDGRGERVAGAVALANKETRWSFTPEIPWAAAEYVVSAETALEDPCGNNLQRAFDFNTLDPLAKSNSAALMSRRFTPRAPATAP